MPDTEIDPSALSGGPLLDLVEGFIRALREAGCR